MRIALTLDRDAGRREENDYVRALTEAGFAPGEIDVLAPGSLPKWRFDGLLLGGGRDVDPSRYGRARLRGAGVKVDRERDETDFAFLDRALSASLPVLGICRGIQVANVAFGGTLIQDIPTQAPSPLVHQRSSREKTRLDHTVSLRPGTRIRAIARAAEIEVNSRHHQAIEEVGRGLLAAGRAPDGLVEAVEWPGGPLIAVQWHPENLAADPASRRLFEDFALAVRERLAVHAASEIRRGVSRR